MLQGTRLSLVGVREAFPLPQLARCCGLGACSSKRYCIPDLGRISQAREAAQSRRKLGVTRRVNEKPTGHKSPKKEACLAKVVMTAPLEPTNASQEQWASAQETRGSKWDSTAEPAPS